MFHSFEEKGKVFTTVIKKNPMEVIIQTTDHIIRGNVHIKPDDRLKDTINYQETFMSVTDATVHDNQRQLLYRCKFLAINKSQIVWVIPSNELQQLGEENE